MAILRIAAALLFFPTTGVARAATDAGRALRECSETVDAGRAEEGVRRCGEAAALAETEGDRRSEGEALRDEGVSRHLLGEFDEASSLLERSLTLAREVGDVADEAKALQRIGALQQESGRFEEATSHCEQALMLHRSRHDRENEAIDLQFLASSQVMLGRIAEAFKEFDEALHIARETRSRREEAALLMDLGATYWYLGQYERSLDYLSQALPIQKEVGDRRYEGVTLDLTGITQAKLGRYAEALALHEQALAIFQEVKDRGNEAEALKRAGAVLESLGRHAEAAERYLRALQITRELKDRSLGARIEIALGISYRGLGRGEEAFVAHQEALATLCEEEDPVGEQAALQENMITLSSLGHPGLAIFYGKEAVNALERIRAGLRALDRGAQRSFLASVEVTYRTLADLLLGDGRLPEAEQVLDLLKEAEYGGAFGGAAGSRSNASSITLTPRETVEAQRYEEAVAPLREAGKALEAIRRERKPTPEQGARVGELEAALAGARRSLRGVLERHAAAFAPGEPALERLAGEEQLRAELRRLGKGSVALYTLTARDRYRVLLVTPGGSVSREQSISRTEIARRVFAFREALQDPASDPVPLAKEMYRLLVGPVERDLVAAKATTLLWSLDGVLRYLPVSALHDGKRWLVERYRTAVVTPGSPAAPTDASRHAPFAWGFGDSRGVPGFAALPGVEAELREIVRTPGSRRGVMPGDVFLDERFTREAFFGSLESDHRPVVHIATHFRFQAGVPAESFLVLGDGDRLTLQELAAHSALFEGVDVLSLSACETAVVGGDEGGRELDGLATLARRQGARAVLATLWSVDDQSTRQLMTEFYRRRRTGETKAEALRAAQLTLLRGSAGVTTLVARRSAVPIGEGANASFLTAGMRYAHPYYWAPFVLAGDAR